VLITGASGLIGRRLTDLLLQKGCRVSHLGRDVRKGQIPSFHWNPKEGTVDANAFNGVDTVIHLAGAGIADKRWTTRRKQEILDSRLQATSLLCDSLESQPHKVRTVICASAIGYYGFGPGDTTITEESPAGKDFLSSVVVRWEQSMERLATLGIRLVKIRIGIVLSKKGGALREMARPVSWGIGAPLGSGRQIVSWIHIDDLCGIFLKALQDDRLHGAFNATAPNPVTNKELMQAIAHVMGRPIFLPPIPPFLMRILVGEMADLVLFGSQVSSQKIVDSGYNFKYPQLIDALDDLLIN